MGNWAVALNVSGQAIGVTVTGQTSLITVTFTINPIGREGSSHPSDRDTVKASRIPARSNELTCSGRGARIDQRLWLSGFPERRVGTLFLSSPSITDQSARLEVNCRHGELYARTRDRLLGSSPPRSASSG